MPSIEHEMLVELLRGHPELVLELLARSDVGVVPTDAVTVLDASLPELAPTERRADLVLRTGPEERPRLGLVVEVQRAVDVRKRFAWPSYAVLLRARLRCAVAVVVVTPSIHVAAWARQPIRLGPGNAFRPLVVGPEEIPRVRTAADALSQPALATLAAVAHAERDDAPEAVTRALAAAGRLPGPEAMLYTDFLWRSLSDAFRRRVEELMPTTKHDPREIGWIRPYFEQGEAKGKAEGKADALLRILARRRLALSPADQERILTTLDLAVLDQWLDRAFDVTTLAQLFETDAH